MNTLPVPEDLAASVPRSSGSRSLRASRAAATNQVLVGGAATVCGTAVFLGGGFLGAAGSLASYLGFTVGGLALAGVGVLTIGRAASHLLRYGKAGSANSLLTAAGLGGSVSVFAVTHGMLGLKIGSDAILRTLNTGALGGALVFGAALLLMVLATMVRWILDDAIE
ncbi:MAG: hypothetical protein ACR2QM_06355 [Longimicrobiales bacterium]